MSDYLLGYWRPLFQINGNWVEGIQYATGKAMPGFGIAAEQNATVVRIDLKNTPGLQFYTSPAADLGGNTIEQFLTATDTPLSTVLAINAGLAAPGGGSNYLFGAAISQGNVVCDPTQPVQGADPDVRDSNDAGTVALTITQDLQAAFQVINAQTGLPTGLWPNPPISWSSIYTAVSGSPNVPPNQVPPTPFNTGLLLPGAAMVLQDGWNNGVPFRPNDLNAADDAVWLAARTAVGLSADNNYLFLLTVDGVEDPSMRYGATFYDVGQWLLIAGAYNGLTLDGGGSTAMAMMTTQDGGVFYPMLMNVPHGHEIIPYVMRSNAQFLGVVLPGIITNRNLIRRRARK
jgi:hypothetical protein